MQRFRQKTIVLTRYGLVSVGMLAIVFCLSMFSNLSPANAAVSHTPTPTLTPTATPQPATERHVVQQKNLITHHWALYRWEDNLFSCDIFLSTTEKPNLEQVSYSCGEEISSAWINTAACVTPDDPQSCAGLYLKYLGEIHSTIDETIQVPPPSVEVGLINCNAWGDCPGIPRLSFTGFEPLEKETITTLHIHVGEVEFTCENNPCRIEMPTTDELGVRVIYWADSSYGDQSNRGFFQMRNLPLAEDRYQFELLGEQWAESAPPCGLTWETFPELDVREFKWLESVENASSLSTDHPYTWLGGSLIHINAVDASGCYDNGLLLNGAASTCGMEVAMQQVTKWQNQFDDTLFTTAKEANLPAYLLKGLIAVESQFYAQRVEDEYGLGMLTQEGIDMLLTWNLPYFLDVCVPLYGADDCAWGYDSLEEYHQEYLRGLAFHAIGTDEEIPLIADTLTAACGQTGQLIKNITEKELSETMKYSDLWQLSLGLYHAGSGCMAEAIELTWEGEQELTWGNISNNLSPDCDLAEEYVQKVLFYGRPSPLTQILGVGTINDFDGDGKSDPAKFYPETGTLWWLKSSTNTWNSISLGAEKNAHLIHSDFDGDGKSDPGLFSSSEGTIKYFGSRLNKWEEQFLGLDSYTYHSGADFDGDGKTDPTKLLSDGGIWFIGSGTGQWEGFWLGPEAFEYVTGDFDGDGMNDPAKFIADPGVLWYWESSTSGWVGVFLGSDTYEYVSDSDFDGDGKTDPTKFYAATSTVWWLKSSTGLWDAAWMGPGTFDFVGGNDFDGDGKTDPAMYDPATGILSWLKSSTGTWDSADVGMDAYELVN